MTKKDYYKTIADYYDREAETYDERLSPNKTLQKIRDDFRKETERYLSGEMILDFGCGTGLDVCYFAKIFPGKNFTGIDISTKMIDEAHKKVQSYNLKNVQLISGTVADLQSQKFDLIYVFFGALNTVHDLHDAAADLYNNLNMNGKIVLTFVNKFYPMGMIAYLRRLKFSKAFERLKDTWWGYSHKHRLESKTYYPGTIKKAFKNFNLIYKRGYAITHPAWFQDRITGKLGKLADRLWSFDTALSKTPLWSWGEYVLFVFEKK